MENSAATAFITRWKESGAAERANYQLFLSELCDLLGVARPDPTKPDDADNAYVFERSVTFHHPDGTTSTGRIDLYKRGCFVLEAKQGVEKREQEAALSDATKAKAKAAKKGTAQRGSAAWDEAMLKARGQAEQYARALPSSEGRPPLLIVVDVGHSIELYAEFTRTGGTYVPFPDPRSHRLLLDKLTDADVREMLRLAWTDPQALDPARRSARVTRDIAQKLGRLAASLEKSGHSAEAVATFLMRALFTMFAEDVELLPKDSFVNLLKSLEGRAEHFVPMVEELWSRMKTGGFSTVLREKILRFNGGLFEDATALPLNDDQFALLVEASRADWRDVEPAIFGTLLERALDAHERHKLGAHYTPRAYVERLVMPTVVEPLRAEWDAAKAAAVTLDRAGKQNEAAAEVQKFHRRLCEVRVLDPACGSGNFLYVTLEHLKRLEGGRPLVSHIFEDGKAFEFDTSDYDDYKAADANQLKQMFAEQIRPIAAKMAGLLFNKRWAFLCTDKPVFFTSDKPVIQQHTERRTFGIGTPGVHLWFPVSPTRMLWMSDRVGDQPDGFYPLPMEETAWLNAFTIANATRFLLSHEPPDARMAEISALVDEMRRKHRRQRPLEGPIW